MNIKKNINFYISDIKKPVTQKSNIWEKKFPLELLNFKEKKVDKSYLTYGDYFGLIDKFLKYDKFNYILKAVYKITNKKINNKDIEYINIYLKKHGQFYHPSKIDVIIKKTFKISLVLNIALNKEGKSVINREYNILTEIKKKYKNTYLPEVFNLCEIKVNDNLKAILFLGQWFENFCEFHISMDSNNKKKIIVWDFTGKNYYLSDKQEKELYINVAKILTFYYNPETFEQIYPWHHAAGDFIIKKNSDKIDLKLITVRQYTPMVDIIKKDVVFQIEILLLFFLNLSIRIRIDKLDGTGNIAWSNDIAIDGFIEGFCQAMTKKTNKDCLKIYNYFKDFILTLEKEDLNYYFKEILKSYNNKISEVEFINNNLEKHISLLHNKIKKYF